ncbi:Zn(2)-C6 fungal-type domain-containing protein [Pleurotus pulmonarius]
MFYQAPITPFDGCGGGQTRSDSSRVYDGNGRCFQPHTARRDTFFNSSASMAAMKPHNNPRSTVPPCFSMVSDDLFTPEAASPPPAYAPIDHFPCSSQNILQYATEVAGPTPTRSFWTSSSHEYEVIDSSDAYNGHNLMTMPPTMSPVRIAGSGAGWPTAAHGHAATTQLNKYSDNRGPSKRYQFERGSGVPSEAALKSQGMGLESADVYGSHNEPVDPPSPQHEPVPLSSRSTYSTLAANIPYVSQMFAMPSASPKTLGGPTPPRRPSPMKTLEAARSWPRQLTPPPCTKRHATTHSKDSLLEFTPPKLSAIKKNAEKKQILACLFCRERKIACGRPPEGSEDPTCNQCARRSHKCEYPTESRRGLHRRAAYRNNKAHDVNGFN